MDCVVWNRCGIRQLQSAQSDDCGGATSKNESRSGDHDADQGAIRFLVLVRRSLRRWWRYFAGFLTTSSRTRPPPAASLALVRARLKSG